MVYGARLESVLGCKPLGGSNPPRSAIYRSKGGEATALRAAFGLIEKLAAGALPGND